MMGQTKEAIPFSRSSSGVPSISKTELPKVAKNKSIMNLFMMACCIPMVIGGAIIFFSVPADQPLSARLFALAPIAGCLVIHFVMHKVMGKSCHGKANQKETK